MIYKRKVYNELLNWKNSKVNNSALLIEGARRIGKSTIVEEFAKNEFDDYILIDFMYETEEMMNLFKDIKNLDLFFSNFFLLAGKTLKPGSLIIFDEIQKCPLARQAIKKLVKDGRYYYIETGSLLSIRDNTDNITIPSEERRIEMYPLDYEEFLWAFGDESTANLLRSVYANNQTIPEGTHKELMKKFRLYMVLGGMPKVISIFQETNSYMEAEKEKHYEIDFMFERAGKIVAIEVKSGSNFTTSSLNNLKIKYPQLKFERIVISNKALSEKDSVRYLPIYMAFIL
jgi:predicted AAA+ superfamily ATPase